MRGEVLRGEEKKGRREEKWKENGKRIEQRMREEKGK